MSQWSQSHPDDAQGYDGAAIRFAALIVDGREEATPEPNAEEAS